MWTAWRIAALAGIAILSALCAEAKEVRLALLIGNQDYPAEVGRLSNTHQDARTVQAALNDVGFETVLGTDLDEDGMNDALDAFESHIRRETEAGNEVVAFFYYSGHGAAAYGDRGPTNFLIPARESITEVSHIFRKGVKLEEVLDSLQASQAKAVFVVSDACRNELKFSFSKSAGEKGMARVEQRSGMLVAFATAAGETTPDDGLFATVLADEIRRPGQDAALAFYNALADVSDRRPSSGRPFMAPGKLPRGLCFAGCAMAPVDTDKADWDRLSALDKADAYRIYLDLQPNGRYAAAAQAALARLAARPVPDSIRQASAAAKAAQDAGSSAYYAENYEEARRQFETACNLGMPNGCTVLGFLYAKGLGGKKDEAYARALYQEGCNGSDPEGCRNFAILLRDGLGGAKDEVLARTYFRQACDAGDAKGCTGLGHMLTEGRGGAQDDTAARRLFQQGCNAGDGMGCTNLGVLLKHGLGGAQDDTQARALYQRGCDAGDAEGCTNLGLLHEDGRGGAKDETRAREFYAQGCNGGDARGCTNLGLLAQVGRGGAKDETAARALFQQGCEGGNAQGCTNLGVLAAEGLGGAKDEPYARSLFSQGCEIGHGLACAYLGDMLYHGIGGAADMPEGLRFIRMGCSDGSGWACSWLDDYGVARKD